jgi:ketosteroid isomerase-like protein
MKRTQLFFASMTLLLFAAQSRAQDAAARHPQGPPATAAAGHASHQTGDAAQLRKEIEDANRKLIETFKRGDYLGIARLYTDDATIQYPGGKVRGREAIDKYWTSITGGKDWKLEVIEVGGDRETPYQLGRSAFTAVVDGKETTNVVDFVVIWKRQKDGQYKIYLDFYH